MALRLTDLISDSCSQSYTSSAIYSAGLLLAVVGSTFSSHYYISRMELPSYDGSEASASVSVSASDTYGTALPALLNLVPEPGEVSFQQGYLGYSSTSIRGSLQIKFTGQDPSYRTNVDRIEVEFVGTECIQGEGSEHVDLIRDTRVLWKRGTLDSVEAGTSDGRVSTSGPPGNLDFTFPLTDDLPHCCHIGSGKIAYTLKAQMFDSRTGKALCISTPVHLSRSSPPHILNPSTASPEVYTSTHPTEIAVFFPHGTSRLRRSQAIELRVRIPPPDSTLVEDKGLKLRSVSAELIRSITIHSSDVDQGDGDNDIQALVEKPVLTTVISHSGKAAAFSSSRSVFLYIWLQPVPPDSCESVTQSTIFHDVKFMVRVMAAFVGKQGDRQDVLVLNKVVNVVPDFPPASPADLGLSDHVQTPGVVKLPQEASSRADAFAAPHVGQRISPELLHSFLHDDEYDGYEEASENAALEDAPPNIDADEPPPRLEAIGE